MNRPESESAQAIAANVRAEMARRKLHISALMDVLPLGHKAVARRLSGDLPFTTDELAAVATALDMEVWELWPLRERVS